MKMICLNLKNFLLSALLVMVPVSLVADEITEVVNDVAAKLVQQLPMDKKIALKSLSPDETGLPEDFLRKLTSDLEAALLTASDFEINLANRLSLEDVWQEAVEFNNANFDELFKSANADVMLMMSPRAISTGVEIAITAYSLTGDSVGKTLASSGSAAYNQTLSEQRAASVRKYLVQRFLLQPDTLISIGLGETQLKRPAEPNAGINRRVEISLLLEPRNVTAPKPIIGLNTYTLSFKLFSTADVLKITKALEAKHVREVDLLKSNTTSRIYSIETKLSSMEFEEVLLTMMLDAGVNVDNIRINVAKGAIDVEQL